LEAAARGYRTPEVPLNTLEQYQALGHVKPALKDNREVRARWFGGYMRYLYKCYHNYLSFILDVYFDLVVGTIFSFIDQVDWKWDGFPRNYFTQMKFPCASKLLANQLDLVWDNCAMLLIRIVPNIRRVQPAADNMPVIAGLNFTFI